MVLRVGDAGAWQNYLLPANIFPQATGGTNLSPPEGTKKSPEGCPSGLRGGGYLLFHFRSIIGVARFNFSVRNGKRWSPRAMATLVSFLHHRCDAVEGGKELLEAERESCQERCAAFSCLGRGWRDRPIFGGACAPERVWVISIARL